MIRIGRLALIFLLAAGTVAQAAVDATVDRTGIALGDTLRLVLSATEDDEDLGSVDLRELQQDFEVLQRSTRSNTSFVNGQRNHNRQLIMDITPRRTGRLLVPAFQIGAGRTTPIPVQVSEPVAMDPGAEQILFEAELDRDSVYVQGQAILTVRLQQAVNLDNRSISELELPGTFVVPLEQKSFQRTAGGRPWLVHEVRYAIFPEQSGRLDIPALTFSARESAQRRSFFDAGRGKLVRMRTEPLSIEVLPRPAIYPAGDTWLPARQVTLEEEWSADPSQLQSGTSVTRTIRLRGEGLQGAQLPPVTLPPTAGLKFYPDQPGIQDAEIGSGMLGTRVDSTAIVPTTAGTLELPEVRVPWWDTEAGELRYAVLPARTLQVASAVTPGAAVADTTTRPAVVAPAAQPHAGNPLPWQIATLVCALGWIATLLLLLRRRQSSAASPAEELTESPSRREAFRSLLAACAADQPVQARQWLIRWAAALAGDTGITSLSAAVAQFDDPALEREVQNLDSSLYGNGESEWRGQVLAGLVKDLDSRWRSPRTAKAELPSLYPSPG